MNVSEQAGYAQAPCIIHFNHDMNKRIKSKQNPKSKKNPMEEKFNSPWPNSLRPTAPVRPVSLVAYGGN